MLTALSIRDVVLIERLDLAFGPGLTVLTGETGAGKSILLDSLGLALGARADAGLVRAGAEQASVIACFAPPAGHPAWRPARRAGAGSARTSWCCAASLGAATAARARSSTTSRSASALLRRVGALLVEVQGQHEQMGLADPAEHAALLDAFGVAPPLARGRIGGVAFLAGGRARARSGAGRDRGGASARRSGCGTRSTNSRRSRPRRARRTGWRRSGSGSSRASGAPRRSPRRSPSLLRATAAAPVRPPPFVRRAACWSGCYRPAPEAANPAAPALAALERAEEALAEAETLLTRLAGRGRRRSAAAGAGGGAAVRAARGGAQARRRGGRVARSARRRSARGSRRWRPARPRSPRWSGRRRRRASDYRDRRRRPVGRAPARRRAAGARRWRRELPPLRLEKARFVVEVLPRRGDGVGTGRAPMRCGS